MVGCRSIFRAIEYSPIQLCFFYIGRLVKSNILPDILKYFFNRLIFSRYPIKNEIIPLLPLGYMLNILDASTLKSVLCCFSKISFFFIFLFLIYI